jgi:hypothetical protein
MCPTGRAHVLPESLGRCRSFRVAPDLARTWYCRKVTDLVKPCILEYVIAEDKHDNNDPAMWSCKWAEKAFTNQSGWPWALSYSSMMGSLRLAVDFASPHDVVGLLRVASVLGWGVLMGASALDFGVLVLIPLPALGVPLPALGVPLPALGVHLPALGVALLA